MSNKDKIKGMWNEAVGETKEHIGRAIGNEEMERKGHNQEMKGKAQQTVGAVKETASKLKDDLKDGYSNIRSAQK
jgi:uncharacterized protein YjbJ (UPF0337 family)